MRRSVILLAYAAAAAFAAQGARAADMTPRPSAGTALSQLGHNLSLCECRAHGQVFVQGQETCVNGRVAVCAMDQNVTTWRPTGQTCPQS